MLNGTKTAIAILAISSKMMFAGTMGSGCALGDVTTPPCDLTAWNFGVSGLYLKPIATAGYGYFNSIVTPSGGVNFLNYANEWHWGFKLEGSYHWGHGSDFDVSWYHTRSNADSREFGPLSLPNGLTSVGGISEPDFNWDAVNGEWGQLILLGCESWRFHGGVQFASTKTDETRFFPGPLGIEPDWIEFRHSEFNGFGPRGGLDASYRFCGLGGFGIYFKSALAVLVGNSKFGDLSTRANIFGGIPSIEGSKRAIVPELEAKLGLSYEYALAQADLICDVGWMWFNYFKALNNLGVTATLGNQWDFGASGLYFGVVYKGFV